MKTRFLLTFAFCVALACALTGVRASESLERDFLQPPDAARPWVYWFILDGNVSREGITADFEAMQRVGIGGVILMEVDAGIPRGPVKFMSDEWRALFAHAVKEAERLGLEMTVNAGPGWTGSGGPWVKAEQSMQHVVASTVHVQGPTNFHAALPVPKPRTAYFGEEGLPAALLKARDDFYVDVAVLAVPAVPEQPRISDVEEKALYLRHPYSSRPGTKPFLSAPAEHPAVPSAAAIPRERIIDLTARLGRDGQLEWQVPEGRWTILRFGRRSTGANTRPSPLPGLGLECDKFDQAALEAHFDAFVGALLREVGSRPKNRRTGWTMLHIDSWEMGAQNWTGAFRKEFAKRRGYDPVPYLPAVTGRIIESLEVSERFLWDLRLTAQELVVENHAEHLKRLGRKHGFGLSIEPYDMNPCADLVLGAVADVPMGEFWANGYGFKTAFSCMEAVSIAHTLGRPIVAAESFTADDREAWRLHPGALKAQADWAFCIGLNRLVVHRYAHQPWLDRFPGMTMGPYGVHYERTQTWWELAGAWHQYLARCQLLLRRGRPVADILFLTPEGAPHVFRPPPSALAGNATMPDRKGYNFDGCSPDALVARARVKDGYIQFPDGMSYRVLVLPEVETMTPGLLRKLRDLVRGGATVMGAPPRKSPSLSGYPKCDREVQQLAAELWEPPTLADGFFQVKKGKGRVVRLASRTGPKVAAQGPTLLSEARWIWFPEGKPASAAPVGTRFFQRSFMLENADKVVSARCVVTADNAFKLRVNGEWIGEGNDFRQAFEFDLKSVLSVGTNHVAITAENGGENPNPAGLIALVEIRFQDGQILRIATDRSWTVATAPDQPTQVATELGPLGIAPWGKIGQASPDEPTVYPDYAQVARLLESMGVPPDFASEPAQGRSSQPLRYTHRKDGETDIYFVANPENVAVETACTFRVSGQSAELWDPVTGHRYQAPDLKTRDGTTRLNLALEPHGSIFVRFNQGKAGRLPPATERNPRSDVVVDITGPWEVRFQAGRGAPDSVTLDRLQSLSTHREAGIKWFSGLASYRTMFTLAARPEGSAPARYFLDLGQVEVMAQVKVNGRELGVLWHAPFRIDVSKAVKPGENLLEIQVANLWPNRLIGDKSLPAAQRVTATTWNPYQKETPLLPSGLLGPVRLETRTP